MQNTAEVEILATDKMVPSTKTAVGRKRLDMSIPKVSYITG